MIEVDRPERLAAAPQPSIFAFNHQNAFECLVLAPLLMYLRGGRPVHFLSDWMYGRLPVAGWLVRQAEVIPVYGKPARWRLWEEERRRGARRPVVDVCLERLAAGASLGIFPEGTRNRGAEDVKGGRRGLGELVLRSGAPVVPVGLRFPAAARLGRPPVAGRLLLSVGLPLDFAHERGLFAGAMAQPGRALRPERALREDHTLRRELGREITARVMEEIAALAGRRAVRPRPAVHLEAALTEEP